MRLLLDTHALIWSASDPEHLSAAAVAAMSDKSNELYLSAASVWELAIKVGQGKLTLSLPFRTWIERATEDLALELLPISVAYADRQLSLPPHHKDPFDRMIAAQALAEDMSVLSVDVAFDAYGVRRVW